MIVLDSYLSEIADDGFALVKAVFTAQQVEVMLAGLQAALQQQPEASAIRSNPAGIYAARNVLTLWPEAAAVWRRPPLPEIVAAVLGPRAGLVRSLYFDKPPEGTWALPWHQDLTIAVRDNRLRAASVRSRP